VAAEQLEFAPRGFFEIGRRNLWGKNRSIDLYTRVSLWPQGAPAGEVSRTDLGFNEYRFLLNFREPRAFGQSGDLLVSGFAEQVIRPSFDLISRGVNTELRRAIGTTMTARVGHTYGVNRIANEQLESADRPLVDRLFPEVTLSTLSAGLIRDTRTDALEPTGGTLLAVDVEASSSVLGSAVGFAKTVLQGFLYRQLPGEAVFAAGARLGLARSYTTTFLQASTLVLNDQGLPELREVAELTFIHTLPASERFFAGGDSTVRGFALDRLGDETTIGANGFPTGGKRDDRAELGAAGAGVRAAPGGGVPRCRRRDRPGGQLRPGAHSRGGRLRGALSFADRPDPDRPGVQARSAGVRGRAGEPDRAAPQHRAGVLGSGGGAFVKG